MRIVQMAKYGDMSAIVSEGERRVCIRGSLLDRTAPSHRDYHEVLAARRDEITRLGASRTYCSRLDVRG